MEGEELGLYMLFAFLEAILSAFSVLPQKVICYHVKDNKSKKPLELWAWHKDQTFIFFSKCTCPGSTV